MLPTGHLLYTSPSLGFDPSLLDIAIVAQVLCDLLAPFGQVVIG